MQSLKKLSAKAKTEVETYRVRKVIVAPVYGFVVKLMHWKGAIPQTKTLGSPHVPVGQLGRHCLFPVVRPK